MAKKDSEINYEKRPIPSGPGAKQITTVGCETQKGGSEMTSKMPKDYLIPDGSSKKK